MSVTPGTPATPDPLDDGTAAPAPADPAGVPFADEYVIPATEEQAALAGLVPDDPA